MRKTVTTFFLITGFALGPQVYGIMQSHQGKKKCQQKITGKWEDIRDTKSVMIITNSKWITRYTGFGSDTTTYFFMNNSCDTVCVLFDADTFVYHIEAFNDNYMDLTGLGTGFDRDKWHVNIISYRKI